MSNKETRKSGETTLEWSSGKVIWVENLADSSIEIIYELDEDLDNLKQVTVKGDAIYENVKKGDRIRICTDPSPLIERE